ncbi:hypothetical protein C8F01DRAFT_1122 [Mycena amicta]|nr:hypothetical protein C8F01DRAFT_1122 [Mycena amicta]
MLSVELGARPRPWSRTCTSVSKRYTSVHDGMLQSGNPTFVEKHPNRKPTEGYRSGFPLMSLLSCNPASSQCQRIIPIHKTQLVLQVLRRRHTYDTRPDQPISNLPLSSFRSDYRPIPVDVLLARQTPSRSSFTDPDPGYPELMSRNPELGPLSLPARKYLVASGMLPATTWIWNHSSDRWLAQILTDTARDPIRIRISPAGGYLLAHTRRISGRSSSPIRLGADTRPDSRFPTSDFPTTSHLSHLISCTPVRGFALCKQLERIHTHAGGRMLVCPNAGMFSTIQGSNASSVKLWGRLLVCPGPTGIAGMFSTIREGLYASSVRFMGLDSEDAAARHGWTRLERRAS